MKEAVQSEIDRIIRVLKRDQTPSGAWDYPFDTGIKTDAYMIIVLRTLEIHDEPLIQALVSRILSQQTEHGYWKVFQDAKDGHLSVTIEAYYALLYSGYLKKDDSKMIAAKQFIISRGGVRKADLFTKVLLSATGQYRWPSLFPIPIEVILLPSSFPLSFYDFCVFGRANMVPILILGNTKFQMKTKRSPDLSEITMIRGLTFEEDSFFMWEQSRESRQLFSYVKKGVKSLIGLPKELHTLAMQQAKHYMLNRIEPDGTFYNYLSATILMIFALLSLGYSKKDLVIVKAIEGLKAMACEVSGYTHVQYTTAHVWNTSLISYALQEAGVKSDPVVARANHYLQSMQHMKYGDWSIHNPHVQPGGWGFSHLNTINPDVDDTTTCLRAIARFIKKDPADLKAWERGAAWALSMQNADGGWPSFEKGANNKLMKLLPISGVEYLLMDPSSADLTGRTLEFYGNFTDISLNHLAIKKGINWLLSHQEKDGSWYGRWGICYIYGTWAAVTGLLACGISSHDLAIKRAVKWLKTIQNEDGGWGESCYSDMEKRYVALGESTVTHTAWALDTLIAASDQITPEIDRGIWYLLKEGKKQTWLTAYPVGQGKPGDFYIHYYSYRYIWPLLALSHYKRKLEET